MIYCKLSLFLLAYINVHDQLMYLIEEPCLFMCGVITDKLQLLNFVGTYNTKVSICLRFLLCICYNFLKSLLQAFGRYSI